MSDIVKPSLAQQIAFIRKERKLLENSVAILEDPKDIDDYNEEIVVFQAIEDSLIALKVRTEHEQPNKMCTDCGKESDRLMTEWVHEGKRMLEEGESICPRCSMQRGFKTLAEINDERAQAYEWPTPGTSVMVRFGNDTKYEWVDSYVVKPTDKSAPGIDIRTYFGKDMHITDPNHIKWGKEQRDV